MINRVNSFNTNNKVSFKARPINPEEIRWFSDVVFNPDSHNLLIVPHKGPDGDCISSAEYVYDFFAWLGKNVSILINPKETKGFNFNPADYKIYQKGSKTPDGVLIVDLNSSEKLSKDAKQVISAVSPENQYIVDHHTENEKNLTSRNFYIDDSAKSCCSILVRIAEALKTSLSQSEAKKLYFGMLSDYEKSGLISFQDNQLIKMPLLAEDKNSKEVLEKLESLLSEQDKFKIYRRLDIMCNLTEEEQAFRKKMISQIQVTPNGKLAYLIIDPEDKQWEKLGMHNIRTSTILRDLRKRLINGNYDKYFTEGQKQKLKDINGAVIFYRVSKDKHSEYRFSIHGKDSYAEKLVNYVKKKHPGTKGGGHPDRSGGGITSLNRDKIKELIKGFMEAAEDVN